MVVNFFVPFGDELETAKCGFATFGISIEKTS